MDEQEKARGLERPGHRLWEAGDSWREGWREGGAVAESQRGCVGVAAARAGGRGQVQVGGGRPEVQPLLGPCRGGFWRLLGVALKNNT